MSYEQALQALREQRERGEIDAEQYELQRQGLEYAHGEAMSGRAS